jgi:hypothetical protein
MLFLLPKTIIQYFTSIFSSSGRPLLYQNKFDFILKRNQKYKFYFFSSRSPASRLSLSRSLPRAPPQAGPCASAATRPPLSLPVPPTHPCRLRVTAAPRTPPSPHVAPVPDPPPSWRVPSHNARPRHAPTAGFKRSPAQRRSPFPCVTPTSMKILPESSSSSAMVVCLVSAIRAHSPLPNFIGA